MMYINSVSIRIHKARTFTHVNKHTIAKLLGDMQL